jgi:hypothetical protein
VWIISCGNSSFSYLNVSLLRSVYNEINSAFAFKTQIYYLENQLHFSAAAFNHHQIDSKNVKRSATVLFPSFYVLGIGLMMAIKQYPKYVADFLNSEFVF